VSDLRYPVGKFQADPEVTPLKRAGWIEEIAAAPTRVREAVAGLSDAQLDTPYRDGGWTVRQVVHHLPDSHMNSYVRFRLAVTEAEPVIKPYHEDRWAELPDAKSSPVELSLALLDALHARWVMLLRALREEDWQRTLQHPETGLLNVDKLLQIYAWHGRHHSAHITGLRQRMNW
jgi:uncharacterized damage-inducible protein DinB